VSFVVSDLGQSFNLRLGPARFSWVPFVAWLLPPVVSFQASTSATQAAIRFAGFLRVRGAFMNHHIVRLGNFLKFEAFHALNQLLTRLLGELRLRLETFVLSQFASHPEQFLLDLGILFSIGTSHSTTTTGGEKSGIYSHPATTSVMHHTSTRARAERHCKCNTSDHATHTTAALVSPADNSRPKFGCSVKKRSRVR
jgi:hypothetical protein